MVGGNVTDDRIHPYDVNFLHYPDGITLLYQTLNPFNGLILIPFQFFFNMEVVYNSVVFPL